jgi:cell division septum initiation protein DivIVA
MPEAWYLDRLIDLHEFLVKLQDHMLKLQDRNRKLEERIDALDKQVSQRPHQEGFVWHSPEAMG